jgi:thymidylate synthase
MKIADTPWTLDEAWHEQMRLIMEAGREVSPRGQVTKELPQLTLEFDMNFPVITNPLRKLGYKFMAAEAWWILAGRDDVESIAPYSKVITQFSDDGHKFFGAYGPPIKDQFDYVVASLMADSCTRQAVITTWRPNPPITKDVPCTVAFNWQLRDGMLNCHVFMRSSDNWLGIPYDAFNFSMITCEILRRLNQQPMTYKLGTCYLTAASSHLYERNFEQVREVLAQPAVEPLRRVPPDMLYANKDDYVLNILNLLKDTEAGDRRRWWEQ